MTVIRLQDGKPIVEDGKVGITDECCCQSVCGINCPETVTVGITAAGYSTTLVFTASEGSAFHSEFGDGPFDFFFASAFFTCSIIGGKPTWTLVVEVCYKDGAEEGSLSLEGTVEAKNNGCPPAGGITVTPTFGDGDVTVTASVA